MTKDNATPRPWKQGYNGKNGSKIILGSDKDKNEGYPVAICDNSTLDTDIQLIVKAVNIHDELVEALSGLISYLEEHYDHNELIMNKCDIYKQTLSKAESEPIK